MEHLCIVSMRIPHKGGICNLLFKILELWFSFAAAVCDILRLQTLSIKKLLCALRFVGFAANGVAAGREATVGLTGTFLDS